MSTRAHEFAEPLMRIVICGQPYVWLGRQVIPFSRKAMLSELVNGALLGMGAESSMTYAEWCALPLARQKEGALERKLVKALTGALGEENGEAPPYSHYPYTGHMQCALRSLVSLDNGVLRAYRILQEIFYGRKDGRMYGDLVRDATGSDVGLFSVASWFYDSVRQKYENSHLGEREGLKRMVKNVAALRATDVELLLKQSPGDARRVTALADVSKPPQNAPVQESVEDIPF